MVKARGYGSGQGKKRGFSTSTFRLQFIYENFSARSVEDFKAKIAH